MRIKREILRSVLLAGTALAGSLVIGLSPAAAQEKSYHLSLPAQSLGQSLMAFGTTTDQQIVFSEYLVKDRAAPALQGDYTATQALAMLLQGTGLAAQRNGDGVVMITRAADPQSGSAAGDGADAGTVAALVVTAQKKEENIQDVPIAISAFTEKSLQEQKIEGGFDLLKAIPNVTFSKNNFSGYNFSIRGIGTKAISVTTDPGVAVAFNGTSLIRNRLFEQEYFDVERVEVLRGPQGTLYGRNATAGVINVISAKPVMNEFKGSLKGEVGNYHSKRIVAMVNVPLVEDKLAIRLAGSLTNREGYDYNEFTKHAVNGRDLWSGRITVALNPTDRLRANLVWERFNENDDRSRTGKQLCHRDPGPSEVAGVKLTPAQSGELSQGCLPWSMYDDGSFQAPNGYSIPFIQFAAAGSMLVPLLTPISPFDPYSGLEQPRDIRTIVSPKDPKYRAKADVLELNFEFDLTDHLKFSSQTAYDRDQVYSFQDYNRFNTGPIFRNTSDPSTSSQQADLWTCGPTGCTVAHWQGWGCSPDRSIGLFSGEGICIDFSNWAPGGYFNDPQIGTSNTIAGFDISRARSSEISQEFRVESAFAGAWNFSAGANYTRFKTLEDYFVMNNLMTAIAEEMNGSSDYLHCYSGSGLNGIRLPYGSTVDAPGCIYIDPNPVDSPNGDGHNYFRSKNPYKLSSVAAFGELYWQVAPRFKVTAGLRLTDDKKVFTPVPSQALLSSNFAYFGYADRGYPALPDIKQHWRELTGRFGFDWNPEIYFTNQTMIYAFYSRGYKAGGANPPGIGYRGEVDFCKLVDWDCTYIVPPPVVVPPYPKVFRPEFVNAFEVGAKNTLAGGAVIVNGDAFFYDYTDYQVSQIKERTAVNENFDAKVWGFELESVLSASPNFRINATLGYMDSAIGNGEKSIDLMNRTLGDPNWVLMKPDVRSASNCVVPRALVEALGGGGSSFCTDPYYGDYWVWRPNGPPYHAVRADWPNQGAGFDTDLSGNKLPNAPHWTVSLGSQYTMEFQQGWRATLRADAYWQAQSWARVYNDNPYDKLHGWYNANLSFWVENDDGLKIELYAKNILDKTPITDAFLNSDDSGLTTNIFVLDPRLIGLSIKKDF